MPTKTPTYAKGTKVSAARSYDQIKTVLKKYGATGFAQAEDDASVMLIFVLRGGAPDERRVRFSMPLPFASDVSSHGATTTAKIEKRIDSEVDRRWRALALGIKSKLVLVEEKIETVEQAFWAHVVMPNGRTIYEETEGAVALAYSSGEMPALLPASREK